MEDENYIFYKEKFNEAEKRIDHLSNKIHSLEKDNKRLLKIIEDLIELSQRIG